ncbi:hypothetical protein J2X34_003723 [Rhodococcus sp. BE178]
MPSTTPLIRHGSAREKCDHARTRSGGVLAPAAPSGCSPRECPPLPHRPGFQGRTAPSPPRRNPAGERHRGGRTRPPDRGRDVTNSLVPDHLATEVPDRPAGTITEARHRAPATGTWTPPEHSERAVPGGIQIPGAVTDGAAAGPPSTAAAVSEHPSRPGRVEPGSERASCPSHETRSPGGDTTAVPAERSRATTPAAGPPARQGREPGRHDAAAAVVGSERATTPDGSQARQRRAPHRRQAAAERAPRRGRRQE